MKKKSKTKPSTPFKSQGGVTKMRLREFLRGRGWKKAEIDEAVEELWPK